MDVNSDLGVGVVAILQLPRVVNGKGGHGRWMWMWNVCISLLLKI